MQDVEKSAFPYMRDFYEGCDAEFPEEDEVWDGVESEMPIAAVSGRDSWLVCRHKPSGDEILGSQKDSGLPASWVIAPVSCPQP